MSGRRARIAPRPLAAALVVALLGPAVVAPAVVVPAVVAVAGESGPVDVEPTAPSETPSRRDTVVPTPSESAPSVDGGIAGLAERLWWLWGLLGLAAGWLFGRGSRRRATPTAPDTRTPAAPARAPAPDPPTVRASRGNPAPDAGLVQDLILGHDLARDEATAGHLEQVLARLGVTPVRADPGTAFDSTIHRAVGTEDSGRSSAGPVIVRVERAGWRTGTALLRQPEVIVSPPSTRPGG